MRDKLDHCGTTKFWAPMLDRCSLSYVKLCLQHNSTTTTLLQPFNGLFSRTTWVSRYQKGKTNLDFTGARDSEWQWHQLGHVQVCTSLQTDNHASTPPLCFLQAGCPSCRPTNSIKALKAQALKAEFHCAGLLATADTCLQPWWAWAGCCWIKSWNK